MIDIREKELKEKLKAREKAFISDKLKRDRAIGDNEGERGCNGAEHVAKDKFLQILI